MGKMDLIYVYKNKKGNGIFGVLKEKENDEFELASINDLDRENAWGKFVIVQEGAFMWNKILKNYVKV